MAEAADALAKALGITRAAQDEWAIASHKTALLNTPSSHEIVPIADQSV